MCPKFNLGICDVAGLEPEHLDCADKNCCFGAGFETCRLYLLEALMKRSESLDLVA